MRVLSVLAWKAHRAAYILAHHGPGGLWWETVDRLTAPAVRAWEEWAWKRALRRQHGRLHRTVLGHSMMLLPEDVGLSRELAVYGIHEPLTTRVLEDVLAPGMVVADVGSNIGYFLLIEARRVWPDGLILAFEPEPTNFATLRRNVEANGYASIVRLFNVAVGEHQGSAELAVSDRSNWHSLQPVAWAVGTVPVTLTTLDDVVVTQGLRRLDLVRMDIEGAELWALQGMTETLLRYRPRVLVEIHPHILPPADLDRLFALLAALKYEVEFVLDRKWDHPLHVWRLRPEPMSLVRLARDPRVVADRRTISALLRPR